MRCDIDGLSVFYQAFGEGRPVIFLHGLWLDHRQMAGCMEPIMQQRTGWRRIYLDLPGMGNTPGADWIKNSDQILNIVSRFVSEVVPEGHFVIGGYSYGAYLAQGLVARQAEQVDGLMMVCPVIVADRTARTLPEQKVLVEDQELLASLTAEQREEFAWVAVQSRQILRRVRDEIEVGSRLADIPFLTRLQEQGYPFSFELSASFDSFEKPTLIIAGRQDWIVGYQDAYEQLKKYPRSTFAVLDRAGHNLPIAQDRLFSALVCEWLDRLEETPSMQSSA